MAIKLLAKNPFKKKHLLLVGTGTPRRRALIEKITKLGVKLTIIHEQANWAKSLADDFLLSDLTNHAQVIAQLRSYVLKHKLDGVLTLEEAHVLLASKIAAEFKFPGNSIATAKALRNKLLMRERAAEYEIKQPEFRLVTNVTELDRAVEAIGLPGVVKPVAGTDSFFVVEVHTKAEAREAFEYVRKNATPKFDSIFEENKYQFLYEQYLDGPEVSVEAVTEDGQTNIIAIIDKHSQCEPYFIEHSDSLPSQFPSEMREQIERATLAIHRALDVEHGVTHTELCITARGPELVEVGGRIAGNYLYEGVKEVWGVDLVEEALRSALGMPIMAQNWAVEPAKHWACRYIAPEDSGIVSTIYGVKEASAMPGVVSIDMNHEVGDPVFKAPSGFETLGIITATGASFSEADERVEAAAKQIEVVVIPFDHESSIGQTERKDNRSFAVINRKNILATAKLEKLRRLNIKDIRKLKIGVLGNIFKSASGIEDPKAVANELTSVGFEIQKTLQERGYQVQFFDMNESPLPIDKIQKANIDMMFNVCERINDSSLLEPHGAALLDILQVPYTGSNPLTLGFCIDKIKVKKLLSFHNIPTAKFDTIYSMDEEVDPELRYPLIVKPSNTDNSIGITNKSVVTNKAELKKQLEEVIVKAGRPALVEEFIEGDEYDVSIIGNGENLKVLPLSRSTFDDLPPGYWHMYPFESKFGNDPAYDLIKLERPAKIPKKLESLITEIAIDTYNILDAHDYARVEMRVDKDNNPYVIELNPNPSIGSDAGTIKCAKLAGYDYGDFLELILSSAVQWYKDRPPFYHLSS